MDDVLDGVLKIGESKDIRRRMSGRNESCQRDGKKCDPNDHQKQSERGSARQAKTADGSCREQHCPKHKVEKVLCWIKPEERRGRWRKNSEITVGVPNEREQRQDLSDSQDVVPNLTAHFGRAPLPAR